MMNRLFPFLVITQLIMSSHAYGNKILFGVNYVPVINNCYLEHIKTHQKITVERGAAVYPMEKINQNAYKVYYKDPSGSYWIINDENIPKLSSGMKSYRDFDWSNSIKYFKEEITNETDPLLKTWKLIIIGHCYLLLGKTEEGLEFYEHAVDSVHQNLYTPVALNFKMQILYYHEEYQQTLECLKRINRDYPEYERPSRMFDIYPKHNEILEAVFYLGTMPEKYRFFIDFYKQLQMLETSISVPKSQDEMVKAMYDKALLLLKAHNRFPKSYDSYRVYAQEYVEILEMIVQNYYHSSWDDNAYYLLLETKRCYEYEGDYYLELLDTIEFMADFLKKYPDSELKDDAFNRLRMAMQELNEIKTQK